MIYDDWHVAILLLCVVYQINQSQSNQFNMHVEYEWQLRQDDLDESDDDLDDKVSNIMVVFIWYQMERENGVKQGETIW